MVDPIGSVIDYLVEPLIMTVGRGVLKLFGVRRPHEIAALFAGIGFWALVAILVWAAVLGW
ncbi:hypothetical protein LPJ38_25065 [Bradyrhizobium daqingense]|uniref:Uncharacterized protein n=1 Tax=Bradyrhizobium daqingense TaxID=993502 RepID=A0A562LCZ6_9BRAD|nr:hypothetical protein [Bradyrhizobium daqingense]TWI05314.1 hypothetical protein IQ17_03483 [Bradyrhizobium daqingense]UFS86917.1 hypothetical protein LPJ38_25065 [Bradyrhizobium daqingense]